MSRLPEASQHAPLPVAAFEPNEAFDLSVPRENVPRENASRENVSRSRERVPAIQAKSVREKRRRALRRSGCSRSPAARWPMKAASRTVEGLREHPLFSLEEDDGTILPRGVMGGHDLREGDREPLWEQELARMFRGRIRLVVALGLVLLPVFTAFYFWVAPQTGRTVISVNVWLMLVLTSFLFASRSVHPLRTMRWVALIGYIVFPMGAALVIPIVTRDVSLGASAAGAVQFVVLASFIHILLSMLLLPFALAEAATAIGSTLGAMAYGLFWAEPLRSGGSYASQMFVLGTTAVFVLMQCHLASALRRRVFDAAFDLALQAARMREVSICDALTGGFNRRHIERVLDGELARAARFERPLSLVMFDLDNFKAINDGHGHAAGDAVLCLVHDAASAVLREVDSLARYGGDEFLIVLPETDRHATLAITERLRGVTQARLNAQFGPDSLASKVTLSVGVLTLQTPAFDSSEVLARVDALLYDAKRGGKNCVVVG